jgi:SulP family sulfate permease
VKTAPPTRISQADVLAGVSVALVLIPQSMAYAELAGLAPVHGLYASALPLIAAFFFASSPYMQSGPVALTSLLTLSALMPLATAGTAEYAALAALLALVVGIARMLVGMVRAGWLVYLMSHSMMAGFLSAAAILILASQLPGAFGVASPDAGVLGRAWFALAHPAAWDPAAVGLTVVTVVIVLGAGKIHPLVPGVLMAAAVGLVFSVVTGYEGATVGAIPAGLPPVSLDLPWSRLPSLIVPGVVISVIGFAEGVSIARVFASEQRQQWDANREFISKGLGTAVAGLCSGLPIGGSLSRTSVNRLAGAKSRWSGLVTGVTVLCFLPFAPVLSPLPKAVLSGIVVAAVWKLIRPSQLLGLWRVSRPQALVAWGTWGATLALAPKVDHAVLVGIALASAVHLWRELTPHLVSERVEDTLVVEPTGVLWFGSAPALEDNVFARLASEPHVKRVVVRCGGLGRIDITGAYTLAEMLEQARRAGIDMVLEEVPGHARRLLSAVGIDSYGPSETAPGHSAGEEGGTGSDAPS